MWLLYIATIARYQSGMSRSRKILIVDDEAELTELLQRYLRLEGFATRACGTAQEISICVEHFFPDVVLLDIGLPDASGLDLIGDIVRHFNAGIIMLTARGEPLDRIRGLELGADDYVPKPFDLRELSARIRALLRRRPDIEVPPSAGEAPPKTFDGWILQPGNRTLMSPNHEQIPLTDTEYQFLTLLLESENVPVHRNRLMNELRGADASPSARMLDVHVARLRKKFGEEPGTPSRIQTIHGVGYRLATQRVKT